MSGRKVQCPGGYLAFVPNSLPPTIEWKSDLVRALSIADQAVGRLAGEAKSLPNPYILISPLMRREAVLSSRIEGTQSTLGEILAVEAGMDVDRSPLDLREVTNYVRALEYGITRLDTLPLSLRLVRELHERLMEGVGGSELACGEFRRSQNWVGPPGCSLSDATYIPPPPNELIDCLKSWEEFLHDRSLPPLVQIALTHYQFEAIHPFLDGNGRVGRLLISLALIEQELLPQPLLYISDFIEATRLDYYAHLLAVSESGQWSRWLRYFLKAVAHQAEDTLKKARRIDELLEKWRRDVATTQSRVTTAVIDLFAESPFWTIGRVAQRLDVAYTTAQRAIVKLESLSILSRTSEAKRSRVYCAKQVLEILESRSAVGQG